ncbi:MAG: septum formation initiator family protein [Patescibacteria group bacterium]|jgi:cell division protein FtsB
MRSGSFLEKAKAKIEHILPMTLTSFILFLLIIYFLFIVGRTTWSNNNSNKAIDIEEGKVESLAGEIDYMRHQINYFQTKSFKEKEAREKLGFKAPGENVLSLPLDRPEEKVVDEALGEVRIKIPNYRLWWSYFFD